MRLPYGRNEVIRVKMGEQGLALVMVALVLLIMEVLVPGEPTWHGGKEGRRGAGWG